MNTWRQYPPEGITTHEALLSSSPGTVRLDWLNSPAKSRTAPSIVYLIYPGGTSRYSRGQEKSVSSGSNAHISLSENTQKLKLRKEKIAVLVVCTRVQSSKWFLKAGKEEDCNKNGGNAGNDR
jgi:hypothetical protein